MLILQYGFILLFCFSFFFSSLNQLINLSSTRNVMCFVDTLYCHYTYVFYFSCYCFCLYVFCVARNHSKFRIMTVGYYFSVILQKLEYSKVKGQLVIFGATNWDLIGRKEVPKQQGIINLAMFVFFLHFSHWIYLAVSIGWHDYIYNKQNTYKTSKKSMATCVSNCYWVAL